MTSEDLATAAFDRHPGHDGPPRRSYLLCSAPRTGSTLLLGALWETGRLATPTEYFDPTATQRWLMHRWGVRDLAGYVRLLHRRRTDAAGLFAAKVHWFQLVELARGLGLEPAATVDRIAPSCRFVHVRRRDRDAQAVSWAIAEQTGRWGRRSGERDAVETVAYDAEHIADCRRRIDAAQAGWSALFAVLDVAPCDVVYEDLVADYAGTVARVADFLGVPLDPAQAPPPQLRRQADERSAAMLARWCWDREGDQIL
ncbi:MAG: Stf0 family sulfotransferase [Egibacteraceae bacterium]